MKTKPSCRVLAAVMAFVMVLVMVPFSPMQINAVAKTYTLDASALASFSAGAKADGTVETSADGFFDLLWSASSSVADGKIDFGANGSTSGNAIRFTVPEGSTATLKATWVKKTDDAILTVYKADGSFLTMLMNTSAVAGGTVNSTYANPVPAGTYYIASADANAAIARVEVIVDDGIEEEPDDPGSSGSGTYVFDPDTQVTLGADKEAIAAGTTYTDGFFTVVGTVTQRVKSDAVYCVELAKKNGGAISFTLTGTADVTVVFSSTGGSNTSAVALLDGSGNELTNQEGITSVTGTGDTVLTYKGLSAGTYKASCPETERNARLHKITVVYGASDPVTTTAAPATTTEAPATTTEAPATTTEAPATTEAPGAEEPIVPTSGTYVLDVTADMAEMAQGAKADGDTEVFHKFFTVNYSAKNKVDGSSKEFSDGYTATQRLSFGGKTNTDGMLNAIKFTTGAAATVKVWWVSGGDSRTMAIYDAAGAVSQATTAADSVKNALYIDTFELAEAGTYYLGLPEGSNYLFKLEVALAASEPDTPDDTETDKIDIWDFGFETFDAEKYNNLITVEKANDNFYVNGSIGSAGVVNSGNTMGDWSIDGGDFAFVGGGKTNHRLRVKEAIEGLTAHSSGKYLTDDNGVTYNGFLYSNSGSNTGVQVQVKAKAGDILTFVAGAGNAGSTTFVFEGPDGTKTEATVDNSGDKHGHVLTFYAAGEGVYKFYCTNNKLQVARVTRQHTKEVPVTGNVTAPAELTGYSLVFTCNESGAVTEAPVSGGAYATSLREGYSYAVSLKDANGYVITNGKELAIAAGAASATLDVTVIAVDLVTVSGNITGLDEAALAKLALSFQSDAIYIPELTVTGTAYTVQLEKGVTYSVVAEGINDFELTSAASVSYDADAAADIVFAAKPTYKITIAPEGCTLADLASATFTFTNLDEEGYVYTFTGPDAIALRDGTYSVKVTDSGIYVQKLTSNLKVAAADVTKTIPFDGNITEWDFRPEDYTGQTPYNGAEIVGGKRHSAQYGMSIKNGSVTVPVSGPCQVKVSVGYNWEISFPDGTNYSDNTNSGDIDLTYSYTGAAGTVTITAGNSFTSYIKKIEIIPSVAYKDTLTVGASGCDYTTISDALDAVRAMDRTGSQRVTIEIQPGDYEEQLVIDVPNVTLKNASSSPSLALTNEGVGIAANAVRITHYYGHGYDYYSMDENCKWNAEVLAVNKENGYASSTNPGSGTTRGSYWNATVTVLAGGFQAEGIIFENSFNQYISKKASEDVIVNNGGAKEGSTPRADLPQGSTAVQDKKYVERAAALAIGNNCEKVVFDNCKFIGRQDTLYGGKGSTVAFYDCSIYGACDYIFGGMTAVFAKCDLVFNTSEDGNDKGYITAPQTDAGKHGLLMYNCHITSTTPGVDTASKYPSKPGDFGRPWAADSGEAVFYCSIIDATCEHWYSSGASLISADGWNSSLSGQSALCGEYGTYEYAKDVDNSANRVSWAQVFATPELANGELISVETWFGEWDPFAGKDMTIEVPTEKVDNKPVEEEPDEPDVPTEDTTFVLDTTLDLTAFAQGDKADGDITTVKDYFNIIHSAKNKVDGSNKTFDDAYTASQRLNFGGKTDPAAGMINSVMFKAENPATVKLWWVSGGDGRNFAIYDSDGNLVTETTDESVKNSLYISTIELTEAGTYYLGLPTGSNYLFKMEVTEHAPIASEPKVTILDATADLTAFAQGDKADGDITTVHDYFDVIHSAKNKVDGSNKTFEDAYTASQRLNFGGKTDPSKDMINAIKFTTENKGTAKIWWVSGGDGRNFALYDNAGNIIVETTDESVKNSLYISTLDIPEAGTYYIGVPQGSNYLFKLEITEEAAATGTPAQEFVLDTTTDLTAFAQGDKADGDITTVKDFFNVVHSAKNKVDASGKEFEDGYAASQRLNFGGKTDPTKDMINSVMFTTENKGTAKIWWVSGGDGRNFALYDNAGNIIVETTDESVKNSLYISTLDIPEAGTYYIGVPQGSNYLFKLQVNVEGSGASVKPERADWESVAAPEVTGATTEDGKVKLTVKAEVGYDGADEVVVTMYDEEGNEIASKRSIAEKGEHTLTFEPTASGKYTFKATISREGEEDKNAAADFTYDYVLPLEAPVISSATSVGAGGVEVVWNAAQEAESYNVYVDGVLAGNTTELKYTATGLTVGTKYSFTVEAVRGEDKAMSEAMTATATEKAQRVWSTTIYGPSTSTSTNGVVGDMNEDGVVTVYSEGGKGKLQYKDSDGLTYYYTAIPEDKNFTFRVKVHVDSWSYSNGQEGFGIMATDRVAPNGVATWWSNQYMAMLSKVEYKYDHATGEIFHTDVAADIGVKYNLRLGVGTTAKVGITPENLSKIESNDSATILSVANGVTYPLDISIAEKNEKGNYNVVGNCTDPSKLDTAGLITIKEDTDFILEIQRNNTGYFITYYDADGNIIGQQKNYDPKALSQLDTENVYVGFFAARNARATFTIEELSTIDPSEDAPAEEIPVTYITPTISAVSATHASVPEYTLSLLSNVSGTVKILMHQTYIYEAIPIEAGVRLDIPVELPYLAEVDFRFWMTPDPDQDLGENTELASTNVAKADLQVTYNSRFRDKDVIYVAPKYGHPANAGTKKYPLDLKTALNVVRPGQTIILMEGTYKLKDTMTIDNSINGTAEQPIRLIPDPDATTRPVLDFQGIGGGLVASGDYWYFEGFDVTNSLNGKPGFHLSGSNCVIENVNAYHNGNSGIQLSRAKGTDLPSEWPSNNLILNCTSYGNADAGYEDADGFAAKLTCGPGNVFDGCVAHHNADDGWDLYAKVDTGPIGAVTIKNCVAYSNGYLEDGTNAGNGNGFKMGGSNVPGAHKLINSYAFFNKAKGIDSNSGPNIIVENCTTYNNESYNVAFYTNINQNTDFQATGIISFKDDTVKSGYNTYDNLKPRGNQDTSKFMGDTNYYWLENGSANTAGQTVTAEDFISTEFKGVERNEDGTINLQGFLEKSPNSQIPGGAEPSGTPSVDPDDPDQPGETTPGGDQPGETTPGGETPSETTPGGETPSETTPGGETPSETTPGGGIGGDGGETTPGEEEPEDPSNPGTGDSFNGMLWLAVMLLAGMALVAVPMVIRKREF